MFMIIKTAGHHSNAPEVLATGSTVSEAIEVCVAKYRSDMESPSMDHEDLQTMDHECTVIEQDLQFGDNVYSIPHEGSWHLVEVAI